MIINRTRIGMIVGTAGIAAAALLGTAGTAAAAIAPPPSLEFISTPDGRHIEDAPGSIAQLAPPSKGANQKWDFVRLSADGKTFQVKNAGTDRCLAAPGPGPGKKVRTARCSDAADQVWTKAMAHAPQDSSFYGLIHRTSGLAVTHFTSELVLQPYRADPATQVYTSVS